jgi:hypothetical protein
MAASEEDTKKLFSGLDYLGVPSDIGNVGQTDIAAGSTGIPAPSAPGGVVGTAGGAGGQRAAGGPDSMGLAKSALEALYKTGKFGQQAFGSQDLGTRGSVGGEGVTQGSNQSLSDYLRGLTSATGATGTGGATAASTGMTNVLGQSTVNPDIANSLQGFLEQGMTPDQIQEIMGGLEGVTSGSQGLAGGASSLGSSLGTAGAGAGALGAILGVLAQATGDPGIAQAAKLVGAGTGALGLAGTAGSLASLAPLLGTATAAVPTGIAAGLGTGAATGLATGGAAGAGLAGGAAFAPIAAMMLASTISGLAGGEDPIGEGIGEMMEPAMGRYGKFVGDLSQNVGQQKKSFNVLEQALPYVQSKEELGQLLNSYRNYLSTTQKAPVEQYGGTGPGDPYSIAKIPGTGPVTHGQQTPGGDFGPETQALQGMVEQLLGVLPGERITAGYGDPGGGLEGEAYRRLWQQFPMVNPGPASEINTLPVYGQEGYQQFTPEQMNNALAAGTFSQIPQWDPMTGQWVAAGPGAGPKKASDVFQVSPYWQSLQAKQAAAANPLAGQIGAMMGGGAGTGLGEGMLSEEERRRLGQ